MIEATEVTLNSVLKSAERHLVFKLVLREVDLVRFKLSQQGNKGTKKYVDYKLFKIRERQREREREN